jgi:tRNA-specific 2-thiouridylase
LGKIKALGAFSGGLDGMLAAKLLLEQGIHVEGITFDSPFFNVEAGRLAAIEVGIPWQAVDFTSGIIALLYDPLSGFGKNMNPCIDCHAAMFKRLKEIALEKGFHFIFSGEVVGQRPMSQNRGSLNRVRNISGTKDILLRPLSARILEPTPMEEQGLVDRSRLLDLNGRGRTKQLELAKHYGFSLIPAPAGGCLLTDPGYSLRLGILKEAGLLTGENARMIRFGRMFRIHNAVGLVGRSEEESIRMQEAHIGIQLDLDGIPGPLGVLLGEKSEASLTLLTSIMASYTKAGAPVRSVSNIGETFTARSIDVIERDKYSVVL